MVVPAVEFQGVTKVFAGVTALRDVTLSINPGECHALVGENGAGKSTLGKVLAGIHLPDGGGIRLAGRPCRFHSPREALRAGVGMVHQELAFCPDLSVAENLSLGRWPRRMGLFVDRKRLVRQAEAMLKQVGVRMDVRQPMRQLTTAREQLVQIAAAVGAGARVLVFDEPTSSLSDQESGHLFDLLARLRGRGVTIIYVSHRMAEVLALSDRISVLRDGVLMGTVSRDEANESKLVSMMTGRDALAWSPAHVNKPAGEVMLSVSGLCSPGRFAGVNFELRAGEVVTLAGLVGSGRSEVAQALFGLDRRATGQVTVGGKVMVLGSVRVAMRAGLGLVPEDRKRQGLVMMMSGRGNFSLANLSRFRRGPLFDRGRERREAAAAFAQLRVKTPSVETPVVSLSGGNQQKIVLARWLARRPRVLIVDEPTRGIDVGAKVAVHTLLDELASQGAAVLVISSDLPEVLAISRRILVMREGRLVGSYTREQATERVIVERMTG